MTKHPSVISRVDHYKKTMQLLLNQGANPVIRNYTGYAATDYNHMTPELASQVRCHKTTVGT